MSNDTATPTIALKVEGMSCGHCVRAVTAAVQGQDPAAEVRVDLESRTVTARTGLPRVRIAQAIEEEGYKVVG